MSEPTLADLFARSVERFPAELALKAGGTELSYASLGRLVDHIAQLVNSLARPGVPQRRFGLLANRNVLAYASYLAIQRLGCVVVPISPDVPEARLKMLCERASLDGIVTDANGAARISLVRPDNNAPVLEVPDTSIEDANGAGKADLPDRLSPANSLAYILFTSGSTGAPKGVPIRHSNIVPHVVYNCERYQAGPGARFSQTFDLTFDLSVFDLFVSMASGAALIVPDWHELFSPVDFINQERITHWFSVPSLISMAHRQNELPENSMPGLEWSLFCGEQLTIQQARAWRDAAPQAVIENLYGPTELSVSCAAYRLPSDPKNWPLTSNGTVPIGAVYEHMEGLMYEQRDGQSELLVRGPQRFDSYLDESDNIGRFVQPDEAAGLKVLDKAVSPGDKDWYRTGDLVEQVGDVLVHRGRIDDQLKIRGVRMEPGEIEAAIRTHQKIMEAAVVPVDSTDGSVELVAAYTGEKTARRELLDFLRRLIPPSMIPDRFVHIPSLPLNANGKIDRKSLRTDLA